MIELLRTKLFVPRPRTSLVPRPRLKECLNTGLSRKLTLIAAPAGFGKTTLLCEWIPQSPCGVAWLSLDEGDNDSVRFWAYFISSLQQLRPELGEGALSLMQSPQPPAIHSILTALINDIAALPDAFAIVLDDYHLINFQPIHEALAFLVAHMPENMHLVITTRADPPLPLARLRARDQLTEIRANDLRFTPDESAAFLAQVMGLSLSVEEAAALEARTEGWIAGLQIAALSMQGRDDLPGFIHAFSGSHRHILGYLAEEVLDRQPRDTLNFLLQTSILNRLCGSLCDALTGGSGGQAVLENLAHANLFIIPLDDESLWFRYHHLFAEVLQARLQQDKPDMPVELHRRVSEWYEAHDSVFEAVQHALAAGAVARAAQLIDQHRWVLLGRGEANTLRRWLDELPVEILRSRPGLSLAYAWILSLLEQPEAIEAHLLDAESALAETDTETAQASAGINDAIRGEIATLRADIALSQSAIPRAIALCRQALDLLPEDHQLMRGVTTYFLGHGERRSGHMVEAERAYIEASDLGLQTDNLLLALHALAYLSEVQIAMGHLREAAETSHRILEITAERQRQAWPVAGLAYQGLGKSYYEWDDLDAAAGYLRLGIENGQRGGLISLEINSRTTQAFTLQSQFDPGAADQMSREIAVMSKRNHHPAYIAQAAVMEARLRLRQSRTEQAVRWVEICGLSLDDADMPYSRQAEYLTMARVLIAQGKLEGVENMLDRLLQSAEGDQRTGDVIEILNQLALLSYASGKKSVAFHLLERALNLAKPEGYVRSFVDEGEPMYSLLFDYWSQAIERVGVAGDDYSASLLDYTSHLLSAFSPHPMPVNNPLELPIEPVSERELEVLHLINSGLTNQEIADQLVIAVSTVKTHINHLYGKFGVRSRIQAVANARELGLLAN